MPQHEAWRLGYREHRYCQHLSQQELNRRIRDVFLRMLTLTPEAKIGVLGVDPEGIRWMALWTHVLEEMVLRFGPFPSGFTKEILHTEPFPDFAGELASRAASKLEHLRGKNVAIKFGKPEHMKALYEHGALRIQAAKFLQVARPQRRHTRRRTRPRHFIALGQGNNPKGRVEPARCSGGPNLSAHGREVRVEDGLLVVLPDHGHRATTPEAQACVVIKDLRRFTHTIRHVVAPRVRRAQFRSGPVAYIDPVLPQKGLIDVPMSKHFRYSHQQEHRFVWLPQEPEQSLPYLDIELGSLEEYAELVSL